MNKEKYQESLNDIIRNCKGFPCKNDSFHNLQVLIDNRYLEFLKLQEKTYDLQQRIDKAIEYIKKCRDYHKNIHKQEYIYPDEIIELLNILKGENK